MSSAEHMGLQFAKEALIEDLHPKYIMNDLLIGNIVTEEEKTNILSWKSPEQQAEKLFDILLQKSSSVLNTFFEVLKKQDKMGVYYPWLAEKCYQSTTYVQVNEVLISGGVPFQTNCLLSRDEKLKIIKGKLLSAILHYKKRHWVVLYGITGAGKSVLIAETISDKNFIEKYFPNGVFWISLGNLQDETAIGLKMKKLFSLMNAETSAENLNALTQELKKVIEKKKILLILDDVWEYKKLNVAALFDIGCPILVTTKFRNSFDKYSAFCSFIKCDKDFTIDKSKKLCDQYVECEALELPCSVDSICLKCNGSPFAISHISCQMASYGINENGCQDLNLKIESKRLHLSGDNFNKIIHATLDIKQIEEYKDYFFDFVIFPKDEWVHNKERHVRLVNKYLQLCKTSNGNYDFSLLPKDNYIHSYIGHHMAQVENMEIIDGITLDQIYFDLKFIEARLNHDMEELLWDYKNYKLNFKDQKQLEVFRHFVKKVVFKRNGEYCDIIQWGLFEPKDSIIHDKALVLASKSKDKSYFEWCNQDENQSHMFNLNSRLIPSQYMNHAAINPNAQLIACASSENIHIFSTETDKELLVLTGHSSGINYCAFNSCQPIIASASEDKSVKIFDIDISHCAIDVEPYKKPPLVTGSNIIAPDKQDMSIMTYEQHFEEVLCCNFSPDGDLVVSSDVVGYAQVWNFKTGDMKCLVYHCLESFKIPSQIYSCSFNPDGKRFGTAAYDSLKIWNVEDGAILKTILHNDMFISGFCFSNNHIISVFDNKIYKCSTNSDSQVEISLPNNLVITSCSLSPDENFLACGTSQCTVLVYNMNTTKLISNLKGHRSSVCSVMYTKINQKLMSASEDGYIVHNISEAKGVSLIGFDGNLSVQHNSKDLIIAYSNSENSIEIRKGIYGMLCCKTDPDDFDITACSLSNNCLEVVYGTKNGSVKVFNIPDKLLNTSLQSHCNQINYIIHSENDLFFTCSEDTTIKVWKKKVPMVLKGHIESVVMCIPFKKSNKLLSCSKDGRLIVWNIENGAIHTVTEGHGNQDIRFCDISFDENYVASASVDHFVKVWNCKSGDIYKTLKCNDAVRCCRFSSTFQVIISGCDSGDVIRWQLGRKTTSQLLYQHQSCVYQIHFSQDGAKYLTIADDIIISKTGEDNPQILQLPSSYVGVVRPNIWVSDNFDIFVVIQNSILYVLKNIKSDN